MKPTAGNSDTTIRQIYDTFQFELKDPNQFTTDQISRMDSISVAARAFAYTLVNCVEEGDYRNVAMERIMDSVMIARSGIQLEKEPYTRKSF